MTGRVGSMHCPGEKQHMKVTERVCIYKLASSSWYVYTRQAWFTIIMTLELTY